MVDHAAMERCWAAHTDGEFVHLDLQATLSTMTDRPTVLHVPTAMGAVGRREVSDFYARWFIGRNPADFALRSVSRTVGDERIVDELVVSFTHDMEVPWILPGVGPTGREVRIPLVAIVGFCDGAIDSEHIYWDQAAVLAQTGQVDPALTARLPVVEDQVAVMDTGTGFNELALRSAGPHA
ncbi:nuclear transport factor 2 family protein [Streptomyces sp. NPDC002076]